MFGSRIIISCPFSSTCRIMCELNIEICSPDPFRCPWLPHSVWDGFAENRLRISKCPDVVHILFKFIYIFISLKAYQSHSSSVMWSGWCVLQTWLGKCYTTFTLCGIVFYTWCIVQKAVFTTFLGFESFRKEKKHMAITLDFSFLESHNTFFWHVCILSGERPRTKGIRTKVFFPSLLTYFSRIL